MSFLAKLRRRFLSRPKRLTAVAALALAAPSLAAASHPGRTPRWIEGAPVPVARTEVAAALVGGRIVVAGGFLPDGSSSRRVDIYSPARDRWSRGRDLPLAVDHAAAATYRGLPYVAGGYGEGRRPLRTAWVLGNRGWRTLRPMPARRAAAAAAVLNGRLYVVGGVGASGLARTAFVLDLRSNRWSTIPGPTPREHLAAVAVGGAVYAIAGRTAGIDTNLTVVEVWRPGTGRWAPAPSLPEARGGTGAAAVSGRIVSVGGEEPMGTIASVYELDVRAKSKAWRRLADLPTPRHGLGVVALGDRVYVPAGGPRPGLTVSGANEILLPDAHP